MQLKITALTWKSIQYQLVFVHHWSTDLTNNDPYCVDGCWCETLQYSIFNLQFSTTNFCLIFTHQNSVHSNMNPSIRCVNKLKFKQLKQSKQRTQWKKMMSIEVVNHVRPIMKTWNKSKTDLLHNSFRSFVERFYDTLRTSCR